MKSGWKTTEFWLTLFATLLGAFAASGAAPDNSPIMKLVGFATMALSTFGYTSARGAVKKAEAAGRAAVAANPAAGLAAVVKTTDVP
jgi:hypothetical protein